ncbi:MAG: hypothetical protein JST28_16150 [Acidobacteria bacterium]|nr:hypothetical protein [Acidobacteriota bacterium]
MARTNVFAKRDVLGEVVRSFAINEEINQLLIEKDVEVGGPVGELPGRSLRATRSSER